ncbi:MAG: GTP pyrophosphokinase family protein [Eubacteriales bacterium]|nr:GTP pyrophosphokinase family protein [Eubacteriales bacterium]
MEILIWRNLLDPYDLAVKELITKFEHIRYEHKARGIYCPIEQVTGRVKTISSILDKMQKKKIDFSELETRLEDIAGIRIICQFVEDIPKVVNLIHERKDMTIIHEKNYIDHVKSSGYRSYHVIIEYEVHTMDGLKKIQAEIQIRTMGMNFWSTIEHSLQYKYKQNIPEHLKEKLLKSSEAIVLLDQVMSQVREEIMDAQNSMQLQANLISEILNNIQNLYKVANNREVLKIQEEFYEIYLQNDLEKLERFHKQLDIISEGYRAQSLNFENEEVT